MKVKCTIKKLLFITGLLSISIPIFAMESSDLLLNAPPYNIIKGIKPIDINLNKAIYTNYIRDEKKAFMKNNGSWSTANNFTLDSLNISISSSSTLKGYPVENLFDKKIETAWVEGSNSDGTEEWIVVLLNAKKNVEYSTPFEINWFGMIPGYAKSDKTWNENNRVKSALFIVYSPDSPSNSPNRYKVYQLHFMDWNGLQLFSLPDDHAPSNLMVKKVWLIIKEVYKGSKYNDTCISEMLIGGGYLP